MIREVNEANSDSKIVLYLALSTQSDTPLTHVAAAQAVAYAGVSRHTKKFAPMLIGLGALILRTWEAVLEKRSFYLKRPMEFKRLLSKTPRSPNEAEVARILLMAAQAVSTKYEADIQNRLEKLSTNVTPQ